VFNYSELTARNAVYISEELQKKIRNTRLLIAGCGIGSSIAEIALRTGFEQITLVDGDRVCSHNLNRQDFCAEDIGEYKVSALAKRLRAIYPSCQISEIADWVSKENVRALVDGANIVFDTIDFLSLDGIVPLHDEARLQKKVIISALSVGWGAGLMCFEPENEWTFRRIFGLPEGAFPANASYVKHFRPLVEHLAPRLHPDVVEAMSQAFKTMEDGSPCPAPQLAVGASAVGALCVTAVIRLLKGLPVKGAPEMMIVDLDALLSKPGVRISAE